MPYIGQGKVIESLVQRLFLKRFFGGSWEMHFLHLHRVGKAVVRRMTKMNQFATEAPVHILVVAERGNWLASIGKSVVKLDYRPIDLGILVAHLVLAAQAEGVGSCVLGWFNEEAVRKEVGIPKSKKIALDIVPGYSEQATREKKRKDPKSILHWDKW